MTDLLTAAVSTSKKAARYAYIAPYREQAKLVAWNYLKHYAESAVRNPATDMRESDLSVEIANTGAIVRLFGADNPNALRGTYWDGAVLDETANMRASVWGEIVRPALTDRKGWAVFIGTPQGHDQLFYEKWKESAHNPEWFRLMLKASETGLLSADELRSAERGMSSHQYAQEFECSFEAAITGAIFAKELARVESEGRITRVPYDSAGLVSTAWDIGRGDATAIWFFQLIGGEVRIIDYYEATGEQAPFYLGILKKKSYNYDTAYLPHDASHERITGQSFVEVVRQAGLRAEVLPNLGLEEGINAARMLFSRCVFDAKNCEKGLEALRAYQWSWNDRMGISKTVPLHSWASHGADAFRYLAMSGRAKSSPLAKSQRLQYPKRFLA